MPIEDLLDQRGQFHRQHHRWIPDDLLHATQVRTLLKDIRDRYDLLAGVEAQFKGLAYTDQYFKALHQMRLDLRVCHLTWRMDQLRFLQSVSAFYSSYGHILFLLDRERSLINTTP